MKTYIVKDKTGLSGSIKEIYAHQYDSRRHILISEGPAYPSMDIPKKYPVPEKFGSTDGISGDSTTSTPAPSTSTAPSVPARPARPAAPRAARPAAPRAAAPATPAKPAAPQGPVTSYDDDSNSSYWNREAERNRAQGGKPLPNEFNIFGKKNEAPKPAAPTAPKPAAPKATTPPAPQRPAGRTGPNAEGSQSMSTPSKRVPEINAPIIDREDERKVPLKLADTGSGSSSTSTPKPESKPIPKLDSMFTSPSSTTTTRDAMWRSTDPNTTVTKDTLWRSTDPNTTVTRKLNTVEEVEFSAEEIAHLNSIMEANPVSPTDPEINRTARKIGNTDQVGSSVNTNTVSSRDLTDETIREGKDVREYGYEGDMAISQIKSIMNHSDQLMKMLKPDTDLPEWVQKKITLASDYIQTAADYMATEMNEEVELEEGRGRPPKPGSAAWKRKHGEDSADAKEPTHQGRDPRQHIQVVAGQAGAGRHIDFKHNDGSVSKITPPMGRRIVSHLNSLKPAERQAAVNKMHDSSDGLKV